IQERKQPATTESKLWRVENSEVPAYPVNLVRSLESMKYLHQFGKISVRFIRNLICECRFYAASSS
ncbi:MAG: hypothetical protein ACO3LE_10980, partial [Bdellovibrionota bacterium]